jgi:hypothetical protein
MTLACVNAGLWSIGNGLISTTLIVYLALEHKASGLAISRILAAPKFAGMLRMAVRHRICIPSECSESPTLGFRQFLG